MKMQMTWPGDEEEGDIDNDDDPEADNAIVDGGEDTDGEGVQQE